MSTDTPPMLAGIKVLDFTQYLAGPTATRLMAELGAEIIKVEQAKGGDPSRALPFVKDGRSIYYIQQNRGKKSFCVDFSKPEGVELVRALIPHVDVVIENYGPGVMEKRGLDYASLRQLNPGLVMCSVSAFGRKSPLSHLTGYDYIAQAFSGIMHMTGDADGPPPFCWRCDCRRIAGVNAFAALGYALLHRTVMARGNISTLRWLMRSITCSRSKCKCLPPMPASTNRCASAFTTTCPARKAYSKPNKATL